MPLRVVEVRLAENGLKNSRALLLEEMRKGMYIYGPDQSAKFQKH
jgi:hypothetical protein